MAFSDLFYRDERMKSVQTVMVSPPGLSRVNLIKSFANFRTTYTDLANQSTRRFTDLISQASLLLTQKMQDSNGVKTEGVIILSFLDLFTNHDKYCLANAGTIAKMVRSTSTVIDHVLKTSTHKLVIITPYIHANKNDLARLLHVELELYSALGLDPDISPFLFKRVRLFSIFKHCSQYLNTDPRSSTMDILMEKTNVGFQLSKAGSYFIGTELSAIILNWISKFVVSAPSIPALPHSKKVNVKSLFNQLPAEKKMTACPQPIVMPTQAKFFPELRTLFHPEPKPFEHDYIPKSPMSPPTSAGTVPAPKASVSLEQKKERPQPGSKENGNKGIGCAIPPQTLPTPQTGTVQSLALQNKGPKPQENTDLNHSEEKGGPREDNTPTHQSKAILSDPAKQASQASGSKSQFFTKPDPVQETGTIPLATANPTMEVDKFSPNLTNSDPQAPQASGTKNQIIGKPDPLGKKEKAPQSQPNPASLNRPDPAEIKKEAPSSVPIPAALAPKAPGPKSKKKRKKPKSVQEKTPVQPTQSMTGSATLPKKKKKSRRNRTRALPPQYHAYHFPGAATRARHPWIPTPLPYSAYPPYLPPRFY